MLVSLLLRGELDQQTTPLRAGSPEIPVIEIPEQATDAADRRVAELIAALRPETDQRKRDHAAQVLMNIGPPAVEPLVMALKNADRSTKVHIVRILGVIKDRRSVYPLAECLRHQESEVRKSAAEALGKIGDPRARLGLMKAQRDREPAVRAAVKRALERLQDGQ